jgi:TP901 family phage tail tape measure protein
VAGVNIVEILVKAKDMTAEGFDAANAQSSAFGEKLQKVGMLAGGALLAVGAASVVMAAKYQEATTRLQTQAGVTGTKLAALKSGVLALAGQVGFSPDSLAVSMYHVASNMQSLGASAPTMLNAVKVAAEGARVGGADLEDTTNALTAAIASGIPGVKNYQQAMGMLNAIVGSGDMKMQDLAEAFGSGMVATVKGFGLSLKDVGAALAVFGDNNIRGAHAGTQLRMSVMALASPAKAGVAQLQQWGMSADSLAKDMQHGGLLPALEDLQNHFRKAGITAKQQGEVITNMFGKKAGAGLNVLMDQMDRLKSKYPDITKGANDFGAAWAATQKTATQQFAEIRSGLEALLITIGEKLLPYVQSFMNLLLRHKSTVVEIGAAVAVLAGGLAILAAVIKTVEIVTKAWELVQAVLDAELIANPIGVIVMAIATLVLAIVEAYKHSELFREIVHAVWQSIKEDIVLAVAAIKATLQWFSTLPGDFHNWFFDVYHAIVDAWQAVDSFVRSIPGRIVGFLANLPSMLFRAGVNAMKGLLSGITSMIGSVGSAVAGIASKVAGFFGLSPAVEGPLSGSGAPEIRGRHFVDAFASGMLAGLPGLGGAAGRVAGATVPGIGGGVALAGGGGRTYNLEVKVPPVSDPASVGRAIVNAIREFERSSGTSWRA